VRIEDADLELAYVVSELVGLLRTVSVRYTAVLWLSASRVSRPRERQTAASRLSSTVADSLTVCLG